MQFPIKPPAWVYIVLSLFAVSVLSVTFALVDDDGDGKPDRIDITVNTRPADGAATKTISTPAPLAEKAAEVTESDLRTSPAETPQPQLDRAEVQRDRIRELQDPLPTAGASGGFKGCVTRFVRNQSSRNGVRPQVQVLHYTVSPNRPGWDDVNAIINYFNTASSRVSSHFVIDREGNCAYIVPIEHSAWTQAAGNPIAVSYEIINSGSEGSYMDTAGYRKLADVARQVAARTGIPMRRGAISGCSAARTGIVQHADGGICWGGHHDIGPYSIDAVVRTITTPAPSSRLTKLDRRLIDRRCAARRRVVAAPKGTVRRLARLAESRVKRQAVRNQMRRLTALKRSSGRPWSFRHRGVRRHELARAWTGKGCVR